VIPPRAYRQRIFFGESETFPFSDLGCGFFFGFFFFFFFVGVFFFFVGFWLARWRFWVGGGWVGFVVCFFAFFST